KNVEELRFSPAKTDAEVVRRPDLSNALLLRKDNTVYSDAVLIGCELREWRDWKMMRCQKCNMKAHQQAKFNDYGLATSRHIAPERDEGEDDAHYYPYSKR
ncbi:hypothetical protein LTR17_008319, partial [Elasticomyces elasticus]